MSRKRNSLSALIKGNWIITCEHAGAKIPKEWRGRISIPDEILQSHEGIDIGAGHLAKILAKKLDLPLFYYDNTRLLIELNRSLHHHKLFSRFSNGLSKGEKEIIIRTLYQPYREGVREFIRRSISAGIPVVHLSIHSFTPILNGEVRNTDIGLLYDPQSEGEKEFCLLWQKKLESDFRVRRNYPYLGIADGFVTALRKEFGKIMYNGIELEVNQALLQQDASNTEKKILESVRLINFEK
jgi:predicted N-formylglutamate amidohydrolase